MAKSVIGNLCVNIVANTRQLVKGLMLGRTSLKQFSDKVMSVAGAVTGLNGVIGGVTAGAFAMFANTQLSIVGDLGRTAEAIGMTTRALGGLQYAAQSQNIDAERMVKVLGKMQMGITANAKPFEDLGLSFEVLKLMSPAEQFAAIADALRNVASQGQKMQLVKDIFGKGSEGLITLLALSREEMKKLNDEAASMGLLVSEVDVQNIKEYEKAVTKLRGIVTGMGRQLVIDITPAAATAVDTLNKTINAAKWRPAAFDQVDRLDPRVQARLLDEQVAENQKKMAQYAHRRAPGEGVLGFLMGAGAKGGREINTVATTMGNVFKAMEGGIGSTVRAGRQMERSAWFNLMFGKKQLHIPMQIQSFKFMAKSMLWQAQGMLGALRGAGELGRLGAGSPAFAPLAERGTPEAYRAMNRVDPVRQLSETSKLQLKEIKVHTGIFKDIGKKLGEGTAKVVSLLPF